jgi:hypothetical protein
MDAIALTSPAAPAACALQPIEVSDFDFAYGARNPRHLLPPPSSVMGRLTELKPWLEVSRACLAHGFDGLTTMRLRPGVDTRCALRHLGALINARLPDADKLAGVAVLMHAWFDEVALPDGPAATH